MHGGVPTAVAAALHGWGCLQHSRRCDSIHRSQAAPLVSGPAGNAGEQALESADIGVEACMALVAGLQQVWRSMAWPWCIGSDRIGLGWVGWASHPTRSLWGRPKRLAQPRPPCSRPTHRFWPLPALRRWLRAAPRLPAKKERTRPLCWPAAWRWLWQMRSQMRSHRCCGSCERCAIGCLPQLGLAVRPCMGTAR